MREREFLHLMDMVLYWAKQVALISPYAYEGTTSRPSFPVETMLRIHFLQR